MVGDGVVILACVFNCFFAFLILLFDIDFFACFFVEHLATW